jgi:hypothetical protein
MTFLLPKNYHSIIEFAIDLKEEEDIQHFFFNQYQLHNPTNTNFINKLKETIFELENRFNLLIKRHEESWEEAKEWCEKEGKEYKVLKITDWANESFFYLNGVLNRDFPLAWNGKEYKLFTIKKLEEIKLGFEQFIEMNIIEKEIEEIEKIDLSKKIKWKGKPSQFGFLILELAGKGWIDLPTNSYKSGAKYLLEIFDVDTTFQNLENEINPNKNSLELDNQRFLTIRNRKE